MTDSKACEACGSSERTAVGNGWYRCNYCGMSTDGIEIRRPVDREKGREQLLWCAEHNVQDFGRAALVGLVALHAELKASKQDQETIMRLESELAELKKEKR